MNEDELTKLLKQIASTDKTPRYGYHKGWNYLNANDVSPEPGCAWCTPREICNKYLRDIEQGTLEDAVKRLMGGES
jgi:hypothetical protein